MTGPLKIFLINMPFATANTPSLALTQLHSVIKNKFRDKISVETLYLNLDFVDFMGDPENYHYPLSEEGMLTGAGDWLFRQEAFPEQADNIQEYFARFYFDTDEKTTATKQLIEEKRPKIRAFLDELITRHGLDKADIVGFTSMFAQNIASFAMARRLKERNPDITTIMGGSACEGITSREFAKHISQVDFFFSGPGLVGFPKLIEHFLNGEKEKCQTINGVFSKENADDKDINIIGDELDINAGVELDYDPFLEVFGKTFANKFKPTLLFETSRGCYWAKHNPCSFCGLNGLSLDFNAMNPENAIKQFNHLFSYAEKCSYFVNVDNSMPRGYLKTVFPKIHAPEKTKMRYEVRTDLSPEDIQTLCETGITIVQPGIEALASSTLDLMQKGITAFTNISFLKNCSMNPIALEWNLLIGSPNEETDIYEKYLEDIPLLTHLPAPRGTFPIEFVRFSHYFENPEQYNLKLRPHDFCSMAYPLEESVLMNTARRFVDDNLDQDAQNEWLDKLNSAVSIWQARWLGSDNCPPAKLCFSKEKPNSVYDSRSEKEIQHKLTNESKKLLDILAEPRTRVEIISNFNYTNEDIEDLKSKGLLFEENETLLSLVC